MLNGFDPTTIQDDSLRAIVRFLMNQVEDLAAKVQHHAEEIQRLRDENNRLKGEQGQPTIKPNRLSPPHSSETERATPKPRRKCAKQATLRIDRTQTITVDRSTLPADARFKGYQRVIVQDVRLTTDTVCFRKETWYSPSLRQTILAPNPPGYDGQFGPGIKALVLTLAFESGMSEPIIRRLLTLAGISISAGQLSNLVVRNHDTFHDDRTAILKAGLASSPWQHHPKGSRHHGHAGGWRQCPRSWTVQSAVYRVYHTTLPQCDRLHVLDGLQGGQPRHFRVDSTSERLMRLMDVLACDRRMLVALPRETVLNEGAIDTFFLTHGQQFKPVTTKRMKDALAIAAYHAQRDPLSRPACPH